MAPDPLRIVVIGSSVGYYMRPPRAALADRTYAEHVELLLSERGVPARVTNTSRWSTLVSDANREIEARVLGHAPDVVVVNFGLLECEPATVPMWLLRWLLTNHPSTAAPARAVRRVLAPPVMRAYVGWSPRVLRRVRLPNRMPEGRFERELAQFVARIRHERGGLVVLLGVGPSGDRLEEVLPGTRANAVTYSAAIERVAAAEPEARYVDVARLVSGSPGELMPDGIHLSARGHAVVGEAVAAAIADWLPTD